MEKQQLEQLSLLAGKIYSLSSILKEYCKNHSKDIMEIENLYFLVEKDVSD